MGYILQGPNYGGHAQRLLSGNLSTQWPTSPFTTTQPSVTSTPNPSWVTNGHLAAAVQAPSKLYRGVIAGSLTCTGHVSKVKGHTGWPVPFLHTCLDLYLGLHCVGSGTVVVRVGNGRAISFFKGDACKPTSRPELPVSKGGHGGKQVSLIGVRLSLYTLH